jgi:parvulin-like peptidyl-prolyl isomerase
VQTTFGYHLIKVTSRAVEPLDATVTTNIHRREAGQRLNKFVADAHVKLNPEFGSYDGKVNASGEVAGVVPPLVPSLAPESTTSTTMPGSTGGSTSGG